MFFYLKKLAFQSENYTVKIHCFDMKVKDQSHLEVTINVVDISWKALWAA